MKIPHISEWTKELGVAVTVCDADGVILYMNNKSVRTFEKSGGYALVGKSLYDCHNPQSKVIIRELLSSGRSNTYTIEKAGLKKLIHQTPWFTNGKIAGLVELSIELPDEMPHFVRDKGTNL